MGGKVVWCGGVDALGKPVPYAGIYRVNGNLALSRAIGDRSERPAVTSEPDVTTYNIEEGDEFIVLGSDGLWDVMSSQEVVAFVHTTLQGAAPAVVSGAFLLLFLL
jgi:serine/threonine protein phosphatase PrpC